MINLENLEGVIGAGQGQVAALVKKEVVEKVLPVAIRAYNKYDLELKTCQAAGNCPWDQ